MCDNYKEYMSVLPAKFPLNRCVPLIEVIIADII